MYTVPYREGLLVTLRIAIPDMISPSYFPAIAAVELGHLEREGVNATIELVYPVTRTYELLRDGDLDYAGGAAHAALGAFPGWKGCQLRCALSQGMYWFLVVRADLNAERGDLTAAKGLRLGAAPGPVDGLRQMLAAAGINPEHDVDIGPVPGAAGAGVSFGVTAAQALEDGLIDGFWANGMGAEVAIERGAGVVLVDARRGDGPAGAEHYTFPALVATSRRAEERPDEVAAVTRGIVAAMADLRSDPSRAVTAAEPHFPDFERSLIERLIGRDAAFYQPAISPAAFDAVTQFARKLGLVRGEALGYDDVVALTTDRNSRAIP